jgi:hypothetical protein
MSNGCTFAPPVQDLNEVVGFRVLQRREVYVRLQFLQPQLLSNRQHVPAVLGEASVPPTDNTDF